MLPCCNTVLKKPFMATAAGWLMRACVTAVCVCVCINMCTPAKCILAQIHRRRGGVDVRTYALTHIYTTVCRPFDGSCTEEKCHPASEVSYGKW